MDIENKIVIWKLDDGNTFENSIREIIRLDKIIVAIVPTSYLQIGDSLQISKAIIYLQ